MFASFRIRAYDVSDVNKGPVFRIPITAVKPTVIPNSPVQPDLSFSRILFKPNTIKRHFILVPDDATWGGNFQKIKKIVP